MTPLAPHLFEPFPCSLSGGRYGSNIGGAEGAKHIAEALKVNQSLTSLKYAALHPISAITSVRSPFAVSSL